MEGGTLMALSQMAATRQATWRSATKGVHTHSRTHTHSISHSHFLSLMNSYELFITHTYTHTHVSCREHTQLLSATEGSATSLYFIIISLGIFLGCKGIPGGARPLKLSTPPPPSSLPFPPLRTLSRALLSVWVLVLSPQLSFTSLSLTVTSLSPAPASSLLWVQTEAARMVWRGFLWNRYSVVCQLSCMLKVTQGGLLTSLFTLKLLSVSDLMHRGFSVCQYADVFKAKLAA